MEFIKEHNRAATTTMKRREKEKRKNIKSIKMQVDENVCCVIRNILLSFSSSLANSTSPLNKNKRNYNFSDNDLIVVI